METALSSYRMNNPFDRRLLAAWMLDNFEKERDRSAALLRAAEQGTATDHRPTEILRGIEDDGETSIFAIYPPPAERGTSTIQAPPPEGMSAQMSPTPQRAEASSQRRRGRTWMVLLALASALALVALLAYLAARQATPGAEVHGGGDPGGAITGGVADATVSPGALPPPARPGPPVRRPAPVDAGAGGAEQGSPGVESLAVADAGVERASEPDRGRPSVTPARRLRHRLAGKPRQRKKKRAPRPKPPPTTGPEPKPTPATKPGVAPLPYPTL